MIKNKFYITTAIDYVNAVPHLGHALEKIQADVIARYNRLLDKDVLFLSGTDENSLKNVRAAEKEKISVRELVDKNAGIFRGLKDGLNLSLTDFIRTTEKRHIEGVNKLWRACAKDIYKKKYEGLYCVGCEEFYKEEELVDGVCPEHRTKPELVEEENYFFSLSKHQKQLKEIVEQEKIKIIPETRKNEIFSFINRGLEDICVSRSVERSGGWGIDVPGDKSQKIWVWFDALSNYITALGYAQDSPLFQEVWQNNKNTLHVIGKGISRFHAVYWPGMLLSAGVSLPGSIFIHGYLTVNGQKMSKSLGNVINPFELVEKYGTDAVRYFLLREVPSVEDGDFTYEKFEKRYNSDLAAGLGNLVSRILTLAVKFNVDAQNDLNNSDVEKEIQETQRDCNASLAEFKFNEALVSIWNLIGFCDRYIEQEKPWAEGKNQKKVIADILFVVGKIAELVSPFLPGTSEKILSQLREREVKTLFPKIVQVD